MSGLTRRALLAAGAAAPLAGCGRGDMHPWRGGWVGDTLLAGHRVRDTAPGAWPVPALARRCGVLVLGGGVAGLAAARAVLRAGVDDLQLLEMHASAGGNSRGHSLGGVECPLGAHYLPTPGPQAHEVSEWLHEIGLARQEAGRTVYDERHLCHSPQERLFFEGAWHEGLLPPADPGSATTAQYRRFARVLAAVQATLAFAMPTTRAPWTAGHAALDAQTFAHWLDRQSLDDAHLRWYLDYCCRDDYGAGIGTVSAWAGLHYFASRHGFHAPGDGESERDGVLTWPQGNAWLVQRLAAPLGERLQTGCSVWRISEGRHQVDVDLWNAAQQRSERWTAAQVVVALPLGVAARLMATPVPELASAAAALRWAPWLVANLQLSAPLLDRPGAAPAWDNVAYRSRGLGYVDAQHQSLAAVRKGSLLTAYAALPAPQRADLAAQPWSHWSRWVVDDLAALHPDLPAKLLQADLARHGHAMSIPLPGVRGSAALAALREGRSSARLRHAHADLAGYSVFEEAFTLGDSAGRAAARALRGRCAGADRVRARGARCARARTRRRAGP